MEADEILDAGLLESDIQAMIIKGKRNFAIDLSTLDYIYSDAMNKLFVINRKILDVNGRLALLSPNDEVRGILDRSGISNFLKIYDNEDELVRSSQEIIKQTVSMNINEIKSQAEVQKRPVSEFEDLRSEIGSAFKADLDVAQPKQSPGFDTFRQPMAPSAPPPFEFAPPEEFSPQQRGFVPPKEAFTSQPQPSYRVPDLDIPQAPVEPYREVPDFSKSYVPEHKEPFVGPKQFQPSKPPAPPSREEPTIMSFKEDKKPVQREMFEEEEKKKFPVGVLVLILLIAIIGGGVGYIYVFKPFGPIMLPGMKKEEPVATKPAVEQPSVPEIPQLSVEEEKPVVEEDEFEEYKAVEKKPSKPVVRRAPKAPSRAPVTVTKPPAGPTQEEIEAARKRAAEMSAAAEAERAAADQAAAEQAAADRAAAERAAADRAAADRAAAERAAADRAAAEKDAADRAAAERAAAQQAAAERPAAPVSQGGGETGTIFIATFPPLADVYMDGVKIGKSNVDELKVTSGTHTMKFVKGAKEITKEMTFKGGKNPSQVVKIP